MENYGSEIAHDSQSIAFDVAPSLWVDASTVEEPAAPSTKQRPALPPSDPLGVRNAARREFEKQHSQLNLFTSGVDSPKRYAKKRVDWEQREVTPEQPRFTRANVQAQATPSRAPWGTDDDDTVITKFSTRKFHLY